MFGFEFGRGVESAGWILLLYSWHEARGEQLYSVSMYNVQHRLLQKRLWLFLAQFVCHVH